MKIHVVIGACFGDEGKGLTTDYLAHKYAQNKSLVVRFNGGAQAGHTVQLAAGTRHVFKHFGCGTLAGVTTYLSEFFICNPLLFRSELEQLTALNIQPKVLVNSQSLVTLPFDMMINQIAEEYRGNARHGSCGVGISETIERNLQTDFEIRIKDLFDETELLNKLYKIRSEYVPQRLQKLGVTTISSVWQDRLASDGILQYFLDEVKVFLANVQIVDNGILKQFENLIFEGAQGLLLDQDHGYFPYVTRSSTGLKNVFAIINNAELEISELQIYYIARAYLTRHGAGPLPFELSALPYAKVEDKTNVHNMYQGTLRFAWFNLDLLQQAIQRDVQYININIPANFNLLVSCMDQLDTQVQLVQDQKLISITANEFLPFMQNAFADWQIWSSNGPSREHIAAFSMVSKPAELAYN